MAAGGTLFCSLVHIKYMFSLWVLLSFPLSVFSKPVLFKRTLKIVILCVKHRSDHLNGGSAKFGACSFVRDSSFDSQQNLKNTFPECSRIPRTFSVVQILQLYCGSILFLKMPAEARRIIDDFKLCHPSFFFFVSSASLEKHLVTTWIHDNSCLTSPVTVRLLV